MKTIPVALQTHYDTRSTTVADAIYIRRTDGLEYGFTSHETSVEIDVSAWGGSSSALLFDAEQGLNATSIVSSAGFNVDNLELSTLDDGTLFTKTEVLQGKWKNAEFYIFRYNYESVTSTADVEVLLRGWFGEVTLKQNIVVVELRGLAQKLQQPVGIVSSKTCRARLGDAKCTKDLTSFTHNFTVTAVTDRSTFTASSAVQASDYFGEGLVTWTSGDNDGVTQKIRSFASGVFTFVLPMVEDIQIGDTFTAIAGCRKRLEDCRDKFDNVLNFQGEPHRPLTDDLTKPVTPNA